MGEDRKEVKYFEIEIGEKYKEYSLTDLKGMVETALQYEYTRYEGYAKPPAKYTPSSYKFQLGGGYDGDEMLTIIFYRWEEDEEMNKRQEQDKKNKENREKQAKEKELIEKEKKKKQTALEQDPEYQLLQKLKEKFKL